MTTATLSTKGQIVLPKIVRDEHGWVPGTDFEVIPVDDGVLLKPIPAKTLGRLEDLVGCTGYQGPTMSVEDMDAAIRKEAAKHGRAR